MNNFMDRKQAFCPHRGIVGNSPAMMEIYQQIAQVGNADSTVMILGETGTGKELVARAIHQASDRKDKLMVKVNCAALPHNLCESELFGHERGSFTGASERRIGKFELANNGTLFLDEIGDMPLELQVKLLRVLQEKEIERIGSNQLIRVNVRIIAATNKDLWKEVEEGRFRRDLYYRLNVFPVTLPSLAERKDDIPDLASYFMERFSTKTKKKVSGFAPNVMQALMAYHWPGNVRELEHLIERSILMATGETIEQIRLPLYQWTEAVNYPIKDFVVKTSGEHERDYIIKTLCHCNGRIGGAGGAAQLLGMPVSTLNSKMKRLGIRKECVIRQGKRTD